MFYDIKQFECPFIARLVISMFVRDVVVVIVFTSTYVISAYHH